MTTPTNEEVRRQFEAGVNQWPNYSERTLARDGRYPDYYGNPVVQGAWEGFKLALSSPAVVALVEALQIARDYAAYVQGEPDDLALMDAALAPFTTGAGHE
jgi:hypothetical protein